MGKVIEKLNFIESRKCFQKFISLCSSKIERNCTLYKYQPSTCLLFFRISKKSLFSGIQSPEKKLNYIFTYFCKLKVRFLESAQASFSDFSGVINRGVFRTLSTMDGALCENS